MDIAKRQRSDALSLTTIKQFKDVLALLLVYIYVNQKSVGQRFFIATRAGTEKIFFCVCGIKMLLF